MLERTISQSMYNERVQELETIKEAIYKENIDNLTCRMTRKKANGTWTEIDQIAYEKADAHCKELIFIEENKPLFNPDEKLVVVTDEEYEKLLQQEKLKRIEEEKKQEELDKLQALENQRENSLVQELKEVPDGK